MKLIEKTRVAVITETYEIELTAGNRVFVTDHINESGKVIDTIFRDENGNDLSDDAALFEAVCVFIDHLD